MPTISCVICAYNEADRLGDLLRVVAAHPALDQVIVVDDGSTDATAQILARFPSVEAVSLPQNRGKTFAMGIGAARSFGDHVLFLDADLAGLSAGDIHRLVAPVLSGASAVTLGMRGNSLGLYRALGLDFITGERVVPGWLARGQPEIWERLPRWGAEVFLNSLVVSAELPVAVVDCPNVRNVRKAEKVGALAGLWAELKMIRDIAAVLTPAGLVLQVARLRTLSRGRRPGWDLAWPSWTIGGDRPSRPVPLLAGNRRRS